MSQIQIPTDPFGAGIFFLNLLLAGFSAADKIKALGDARTSIAKKAEDEGRDVTPEENDQIDLIVGIEAKLAKGE